MFNVEVYFMACILHATANFCHLTFKSLVVSLRTTRLNIQKFYMALTLHSAFCTDIRTDSDYFPILH